MSSFVLVVSCKIVETRSEDGARRETWGEERFTMGGKWVSFVIEVLKVLGNLFHGPRRFGRGVPHEIANSCKGGA